MVSRVGLQSTSSQTAPTTLDTPYHLCGDSSAIRIVRRQAEVRPTLFIKKAPLETVKPYRTGQVVLRLAITGTGW